MKAKKEKTQRCAGYVNIFEVGPKKGKSPRGICTFETNSLRMTSEQAIELGRYLIEAGLRTSGLVVATGFRSASRVTVLYDLPNTKKRTG